MGLFDRLKTLVSSNVNSALDGAEDAHTAVASAIDELKADVKSARAELVATLATAKRLDAKHAEFVAEATTWEDRAASAVRAGDDALAREALVRKLGAQKRAEESERHAAEARANELRMRELLEKAEVRLRELEARQSTLSADLRRARGAGQPAPDSAVGRLERSLDRVDAFEAELEAHAVLDDPKRRATEAEFRKLERQSGDARVEDELEALKRRLGG